MALRAPELLESLEPDVSGGLMRSQIETATGVCRGYDKPPRRPTLPHGGGEDPTRRPADERAHPEPRTGGWRFRS
ncbi:hypothetical protein P3102_09115 [Amycolatopsis sp. QT-25]|uniref:hypothetical protein n=1 Tax=Amycolatopsis sp. QT-25 TaxID=3034022 RepID=UPI0023EAB1E2|nr:hypothetical protein [Amycolatopsis sp. QT-25]WET81356.1 hypothetical protein P3102_09115 [Amycolatopsis sp. QT-25]